MKSINILEQLSDELLYLYNTGKCYNAYRTFGAHKSFEKVEGFRFTLWCPDVLSVKVVGDWNNWNGNDYLTPIKETGVFSGFFTNVKIGDKYKYDIELNNGQHLLKSDPFAFQSELRPSTASVVTDISYKWSDENWIDNRAEFDHLHSPMNIYEVHLASWIRHPYEDGFYSYKELAEKLIPYVKEMGYTHIEILPIMEHPLDASWGYQVTGYYSATSRHGNAVDFKYFIDCCHRNNIGVIIDWVPGHFCPDEQGLSNFNGSHLYESEIHPDWGTFKFDFSRGQVRSFLFSNSMFWLDEFHADAIRVDGVSSMLYLNFGVTDDKKKKFNKYGEEGNLDAIEFLKEFNYMVGINFKGVFTIAEESTAWPMVTMPPDKGGLGFNYKWNMGWMNDTLEYMECDFPFRKGSHNKLTFAMSYAYSENYILPLSHDEVVHGKKSLIGRMPGDIWRQFAGIRLLSLYQITHPGKKLNFMGHEIAQFIEWREYEELEWFLLKYDNHASYQKYISQLNHFYIDHPALWYRDNSYDGFMWLDADNIEQGIYCYMRFGDDNSNSENQCEKLVIVINTDVQTYNNYRIGVQEPGEYIEIFNSDLTIFGGSGKTNNRPIIAKKVPMHGQPYSIEITIPAVGGCIFKYNKEVNDDIQ